MKEIAVKDLKTGESYSSILSFDGKIPLLEPGLPLGEDDVEILKHWKVDKLYLVDQVEEIKEDTGEMFNRFHDERKLFVNASNDAVKEIKKFFDSVKQRGFGYLHDVESQFEDTLSLLKRNKNFFLIVLQQRNPDLRKFEEVAFYAAVLSVIIARHIKKTDGSAYTDEELKIYYKAAVCANVGMLRFEKMINRPKVPSPQEKQALKTHTLLGYKIVAKKMKMEQSIAACTLNHHEAIDGSGYPRKLKGDQISLMTKVVSICLDYVETMRGAPFTQKQLPYAALRKICGGAKKKYHSALINYLVRELSMYPLGSVVQLKDMSMGVVIDANPRVPLRPTVKVVINADGEVLKENKIINMAEATSVFIHEVIDDNELIERVFENL